LDKRITIAGVEIAFDVMGAGPPLVLVHGAPSWSYLWRRVAPALARHFTVHIYDMPGYGDSLIHMDHDTSLPAQARILAGLVESWGLQEPAIAGHDIGAGIVLRSFLREQMRFSRIALLDAVVFEPWITPATRRVKENIEEYRDLPPDEFITMAAQHIRTAVRRPMPEATLDSYLAQWRGTSGRDRYLLHLERFDEQDTAEFEHLLPTVNVPVCVMWGTRDAWLGPTLAQRLVSVLPYAGLVWVPDAGHFCMEDRPNFVAARLIKFFSGGSIRL
jgi:pimeloyl-ACP methyl ester carboxylesterase